MSDVFISYSRQNIAFAERLFERLRDQQISAWVDWQNIPRSAGWWDEIQRGIDTTSTFIFIMSNDSVGSVVCTLELAHAIENGKRIIPVVIEAVNFEQAFGKLAAVQPDDVLTKILAGHDPLQTARANRSVIGHINWVFFEQNPQGQDIPFEDSFNELIEAVNTDLEHSRRHARLLVRAREWENGQRADDLLLVGDEITQAEAWLAEAEARRKDPTPTKLHTEYVATSRAAEDARLRRLRNIRRASLVASVVAVVMVILAAASFWVGVQANMSASAAQTQAMLAQEYVAAANTTATRIPPTLTVAYEQMVNAQAQADTAQTREAQANSQLTAVPPTLTLVNQQMAEAESRAEAANTQVSAAQATATQIPPTLTQAAVLRQEALDERRISAEFASGILQSGDDAARLISSMNALVEQFPDYALAYQARGLAYQTLGDTEQALADYDQAVTLDPSLAQVYANRGSVYYDRGDYARAIADYDQAIALDPALAEAFFNRGLAYADSGNYEQAVADYSAAITLDPANTAAYNNRGNTYQTLGEYTLALADFNEAITLNPAYAEAYSNRGVAYGSLGDDTRAIADFEQAITLDPTYADAYYNRGLVYARQGDFQRAIADFDQALAIGPADALTYLNRGMAYTELGEYKRAITDFDAALTLDPEAMDVYFNRGIAYLSLGVAETSEAIQVTYFRQSLADLRQAQALGYPFTQDILDVMASIEALLPAPTPTPGS